MLQSKLLKGSNDTVCNVTDSFNLGTEKVSRKRIQDLENEVKSLQNKSQEGHVKAPSLQLESQNDPFWRRFSSSGNETALPYKSPCKVIKKKALETSEENPFNTPATTPHRKGLQISEENPFKTPHTYGSATTLPSAPSSTSKTDYTTQLERKLENALHEIEDLKCEKNTPATNQSLSYDVEICSLKTSLEKTTAEHAAQEQQLLSTQDQMSSYKTKTQDLEIKVESLEQRLKVLQTELDCQRQNSETAKHHLEDRLKEMERECNADASRFQKEIATAEQKQQELLTKLQQQEALALSNQNSLQASLDKVSSQLNAVEKEKMLAQNHCSKLETSVNQLQKSDEDAKTMITQIRRDKEMLKAQVDSLKVKLSDSGSLTNRLQSQLETSEQLAMNQKFSLEEVVSNQKSLVEKEKESYKLALENVVTEKDKHLIESKSKVSELEKELNALKENIQTVQNEKNEAMMKLKQIEEDCLKKLAGVNELEAKCKKLESDLQEKEQLVENKEKELRGEFEESKSELQKEIRDSKMLLEKVEEEKKNLQNVIKKVGEEKELELSKLQQKVVELEEPLSLSQKNEEKMRGEKLAVELNVWELEGKIEALTNAESSHQQQKQELMKKIFELEDALQEQKKNTTSKESELEDMSNNLQEASNTVTSLVATLEGVKTNLRSSAKTVTEMTEKINEMTLEMSKRDSTIETMIQEKFQIENSLTEIQAKFEKLMEKTINAEQLHNEKVEELLRMKETLLGDAQSIRAQLHTSQNECQTVKENLDREVKENEGRVNQLEMKLESMKGENETLKKLEEEVAQLMDRKKRVEESTLQREEHIKQLKEVVQTLNDRVAERDAAIMKLDQERNVSSHKYKAEIDELIQSNAIMEKNVSESSEAAMESEKFIKLMQDENESLTQTLSETNDNLSQLTASNEGLSQDLKKSTFDCKNASAEKEKFVVELGELQKEYEKVKVRLEETDLRLSEELTLSREKVEQCTEVNRLMGEMTADMNSIKENHSSLMEEIKKEKEELLRKLDEEQVNNEQLIGEIRIYKEKFETEEASTMDLKENLKDKELQLTEMEKVAGEVREEFDSTLAKLNDKLKTVMDEMKSNEAQYNKMRKENTQFINICDELRTKLNHQESINQSLALEFENYKDVANVMRRETSSEEETMRESHSLHSVNHELKAKVACLGKTILELQRKNCNLSSTVVTKKDVRDCQTQASDLSEGSWRHVQDIEKLEKELNERESEVVEMGEKMQDLFVDLDKLQKENEKLKTKLQTSARMDDSGHNTSCGESILIETLKDELSQAKLDLQRSEEKGSFNVDLAQELDEKVESIRNELKMKMTVEKDLRKQLETMKEWNHMTVKIEDFEKLKESFDRLEAKNKKLQEELTVTRNQLESSVPRDKVSLKERELSELTQELICVNGQLEAKNNDLVKENAELLGLKNMVSNQMEESLRERAFYDRENQTKIEELVEENYSLENELRNKKLTLRELESERSSVVESNKKLLGENTQLIHRNEMAKEKKKVLEEEVKQWVKKFNQESGENDEGLRVKTKEIENLTMQLDTLKKEVGVKDEQMKRVVTDLEDNFHVRITEVLSSKDIAENQNAKLQQELLHLRSSANALETMNNTNEDEIRQLKKIHFEALNEKEKTLNKLKDENEQLNLKLDSVLIEKDEVEKELQNIRIRIEELNLASMNLKQKLESIEKENEKLLEVCHELKTKRSELEEEVKDKNHLQFTISSLESEIARLRKEAEELNVKILHVMEELENSLIQVSEKSKVIVKQEQDLFNLNTQLDLFAKREEELKGRECRLEVTKNELLLKLEESNEARTKALSDATTTKITLEKAETELLSLNELKSAIIEENVGLNMLKAELVMKIERFEMNEKEGKDQCRGLKEELENARTSSADVQSCLQTTRNEKDKLINLLKEKDIDIHELKSSKENINIIVAELKENLDSITSEKTSLEKCVGSLRKEKSALNVEKESASRELLRTSEKNKSLERQADLRENAYRELIGKYEDIRGQWKEQEAQIESLRNNLKCKEAILNEENVKLEILLKELAEAKEELEMEKQNFSNKCAELKYSNERVDEAEVDMGSLKAKFSLNQAALRKKEKELIKAQSVVEKLEKDDKKMRSKLKEMHSRTKENEAELSQTRQEITDWREKLNERSVQLKELTSKCTEWEKDAEMLREKLNKLQLRNKKLELELSKTKGSKRLLSEESSSCSKDSQQTTDLVDCSQTQGNTLDVNLEASVKKAVTRRAAMIGQTTSGTAQPKTKDRKSSSHKSLAKTLEEEQREPSKGNSASYLQIGSFDSRMTRRITRSFSSSISSGSSGSSGEKRGLAVPSEDVCAKRIKLGDWEGLPDKVRRGLNDIPDGQQSPGGVITRPTTPLKKKIAESSRGPLKLLDTNFERRRNLSTKKVTEVTTETSPSSPNLEISSGVLIEAKSGRAKVPSRANMTPPKSGTHQSRAPSKWQ